MTQLREAAERIDRHLNLIGNSAKKLGEAAMELDRVEATLRVNCLDGKDLHGLGLKYDDSRSVHDNMFLMLVNLVDRIKALQVELREGKR